MPPPPFAVPAFAPTSAEFRPLAPYAQPACMLDGSCAATGYPPCSPGPGDDRCIQLYERGVRR